MSSWSYAMTNKGRQLQAKAQAGAQLVYTRMAVGSGTLSGQSLDGMTALITPIKDLTISRLKRPPGTTRALIGATLTNQDVVTGFHLREVGIFAADPDDGEILYMYANAGNTADYITPSGDGVIEKAINMNVFVGSAANITANIDESLVFVTQQELDEALAGITIEDASTTKKGIVQLSNATNSTSEALAATPRAVKSAYDTAIAAQTTANAANSAAAAAQARADSAFQLGVERKNEVVAALNSMGVPASTSESWDSLIGKMAAIINRTSAHSPASWADGTTTVGRLFLRPAAGYWDGTKFTYYDDNNFIATNFAKDVTMFGLRGALERMTTAEKQAIANAISGKGVPASVNDSNTVLAQKIGQIVTGKRYASGEYITTSTGSHTPMGTISDLPFTPSHVRVKIYESHSGGSFQPDDLLLIGDYNFRQVLTIGGIHVNSDTPVGERKDTSGNRYASIIPNGFTFRRSASSIYPYKIQWEAWE